MNDRKSYSSWKFYVTNRVREGRDFEDFETWARQRSDQASQTSAWSNLDNWRRQQLHEKTLADRQLDKFDGEYPNPNNPSGVPSMGNNSQSANPNSAA